MNKLLDAIYSVFQGSELKEALVGRMFFEQAPGKTRFPYGVYFIDGTSDAGVFQADVYMTEVSFEFYSKTSVEEVNGLVDFCLGTYGGHDADGIAFLGHERTDIERLDPELGTIWMAGVKFTVIIEE